MRPIARIRWHALLALALLFSTQAFELAHYATAQHGVCELHGELVEQGQRPRTDTHPPATDHAALDPPGRDSSHQHCQASSTCQSLQPALIFWARLVPVRSFENKPVIPGLVRAGLLHLAPKTSPPRV